MTTDREAQAYADLQPDHILEALEELGYHCDGRFLALNSYENRVYQFGIEDERPVVENQARGMHHGRSSRG